jgi:hypothetical protein
MTEIRKIAAILGEYGRLAGWRSSRRPPGPALALAALWLRQRQRGHRRAA